jgi:hypothetical protein
LENIMIRDQKSDGVDNSIPLDVRNGAPEAAAPPAEPLVTPAPAQQPLPPDRHLPTNHEALRAQYRDTPPSGHFYITEILRRLHPDRHIAYLDYRMVTLMSMLRANHVPFVVMADGDTLYFGEQFEEATHWEPAIHVLAGTLRFTWKGHEYHATALPEYREAARDENNHAVYLAAETFEALRLFIKDLAAFNPDRSEAILQYEGGWRDSLELRQNLQHCTWDMLVLPDEIKNDIRENAERFFTGDRTVYRRLGLPHKRGFIFIGEPGDGKTLTGKIIANTYKVTFIYVTSLQSPHQTPSQCLRDIYERAQDQAPCVVLIEDLDSQIDRSSRTVFLNILDGFDHNEGILTIATTNNPEEIDRALLDRPSRFDKKWVFPHPDATYRAAYLTRRLRDVLAVPELDATLQTAVQEMAAKTNHYSYAMLQELVVSAGFVYFANGQSGDFAQMLRDAYLKTQEQVKFADPEKIANIVRGRGNMGIRGRNGE